MSQSHGGVRVGSGRPKSEDTVAVRVPVGCLEAVRELIASYRETGVVNFSTFSSPNPKVLVTPVDYETFCVWLCAAYSYFSEFDEHHFAYKMVESFYSEISSEVSRDDFYLWASSLDKDAFRNGRLLKEAWSNRL